MLDFYELMSVGSKLSTEEIADAELQLEREPKEIELRIKLVGYYDAHYSSAEAPARFLHHLSWLISNLSAVEGLGFITCRENDGVYQECRQDWLDVAAAPGVEVRVLDNAARFLLSWNPEDSCRLWLLAKQKEPEAVEWNVALASAFRFRSENAESSEATGLLCEALMFADKAFELHYNECPSSYLKGYRVPFFEELASLAMKLGAAAQLKLLAMRIISIIESLDEQLPGELALLSKGHSFLCRIFLSEQNFAQALEELVMVKSLPIPGKGGYDLDPDLELVSDLLRYDEREWAVQYLHHALRSFNVKIQQLAEDPPKLSAAWTAMFDKLKSREKRDKVLAKWRAGLEAKAQQIEGWIVEIRQGHVPEVLFELESDYGSLESLN